MVDFVNVVLRGLMCIAFIMWVVRPMLMAFTRRELDVHAIEEAAQTAINSAFLSWSGNTGTQYYNNPQLAVHMAENPNMPIPTEAELLQRAKDQEVADQTALAQAEQDALNAPAVAEPDPAADAAAVAAPDSADGQVALQAETGTDAAVVEEEAEESLEQMRDRIKQEQKAKRPTIPPELLQNANSYEDQLMVVRMVVDQEQSRVAAVIRNMIQAK